LKKKRNASFGILEVYTVRTRKFPEGSKGSLWI